MRHKKLEIPEIQHGKRADIAISDLLGNELSRNQVKDLIKSDDLIESSLASSETTIVSGILTSF